MYAALRRRAKGGPILRVAGNRRLEQYQNLPDLPLMRAKKHRVGAQIEVVGGQIAGWAAGRPRGLGRLQCRLDDTGNADRDLLLQFEDLFERAVEAVGP